MSASHAVGDAVKVPGFRHLARSWWHSARP